MAIQPTPATPVYLGYAEGEALVDEAVRAFPATFGLYAHEGTFRIDRRGSFYSAHEGVQVVLEISRGDAWLGFLRTSPDELRRGMRSLVPAHLASSCSPWCMAAVEARCPEAVKRAPTGRWYITMGHAGFNLPANNGRGYRTPNLAAAQIARLVSARLVSAS
jgi:hypothetical protein